MKCRKVTEVHLLEAITAGKDTETNIFTGIGALVVYQQRINRLRGILSIIHCLDMFSSF